MKLSTKEYFDKFYKIGNVGFCEICKTETKYKSFEYSRFCNKCATKSEGHRQAVSSRFNGDDREEKLRMFRLKRGVVDNNYSKSLETYKIKADAQGISVHEYRSNIAKRAAASVSKEAKIKQTIKAQITKDNNKSTYHKRGNSYVDLVVGTRTIK